MSRSVIMHRKGLHMPPQIGMDEYDPRIDTFLRTCNNAE